MLIHRYALEFTRPPLITPHSLNSSQLPPFPRPFISHDPLDIIILGLARMPLAERRRIRAVHARVTRVLVGPRPRATRAGGALQHLGDGRLRAGVVHLARARLLVGAVRHVEDAAEDARCDGEWHFTGAEHVGHVGGLEVILV